MQSSIAAKKFAIPAGVCWKLIAVTWCNQFGRQEPGSESDIEEFCQLNYGVSFPMFAKIDVNGDDGDPLFKYLKKSQKGILGSEKIKWNFTKFLVNREGNVIARFAPTVKPKDLEKDIESLL